MDVPEYLPRGAPVETTIYSRWSLGVAATARPRAGVPATFYFPAWSVTCQGRAVRSFADPQTRLLAFAGEGCRARLKPLGVERLGLIVSLFSALLLLLAVGRRLTQSRERRASD